jgi:hypothetical protein
VLQGLVIPLSTKYSAETALNFHQFEAICGPQLIEKFKAFMAEYFRESSIPKVYNAN